MSTNGNGRQKTNGTHHKDKIRIEDVVVIFGKDAEQSALPLLQQGASKNDILEQTGNVVGVGGVSFNVREGETFVVMGLSGSGKSTLIRCVNRLIQPTSGHIYIDDEDVLAMDKNRLRELRRTKLGMVFQHFALFPHKNVVENVAFGLKMRGVDEEERHAKALDTLNLVGLRPWAEQGLGNLSGGMKQRVGLARALATDADILLMDEAFGALDPLIRREMQNELLHIQRQLHKTVLFITHDLNEALRVGDRVAIMKDGKIVQIGSPVDISTSPEDEYVAAFMQDIDQTRVLPAEVVMRTANYLVLGRDTIDTALDRAQNQETDSFYLVDEHQKLQGVLTKHGLREAQNSRQPNLKQYMEHDVPATHLSTPMNEFYSLVPEHMPLAVVDDEGCLQGEIHASDIVSNLAMVEEIGESVDTRSVTGMDFGSQEGSEDDTAQEPQPEGKSSQDT
jgi:glycine betaine/proline transport system ATP-binding protein